MLAIVGDAALLKTCGVVEVSITKMSNVMP